jgi:photosystem II stability/assembly factor-like uncharacterized protein
VTDPGDKIESWLRADVEPLPPRPGAFGPIARRARRRKASRAAVSGAGVVIVIAAAVTLPHVAAAIMRQGPAGPHGQAAAPPSTATSAPPSPRHQASGREHLASQSATPVPPGTSALSPAGSGQPVPANFQPTSVTFIGTREGAVIGQAGTPGHCFTRYCTSLAGTSDYGQSWYGVSAPLTGPPGGGTGVSQLRFLNAEDGWAYGPGLWVTHDGGAHWAQEQTSGLRVTGLETAGDRAFALFADCSGTGQAYGSACARFSLYSSAAGSGQWSPVPGPVRDLAVQPAAAPVAATLVLTGDAGYLLAPDGAIYTGPLTGAAWRRSGPGPGCYLGAPTAWGQPARAMLAAEPGQLYELCAQGSGDDGQVGTGGPGGTAPEPKSLSVSGDDGKSWQPAGTPPAAGVATSLAATPGKLIVASTAGLYVSDDGGGSWTRPQGSPQGAAAGQPGFGYVGLTDSEHGVAVPADPRLHEVYITTDGGAHWHRSVVSAP